MKVTLKHNRQAPRKVRLVADMIRGKSVLEAAEMLKYVPKKASGSISKMIASAVANAKANDGKNEKDLYIKKITVDKGFTMKRHMPKWRGTADPIRKHTSNIVIELSELDKKSEKRNPKKETKKTAVKSKSDDKKNKE